MLAPDHCRQNRMDDLTLFWRCVRIVTPVFTFFFFNDTATTEIYTLSLHDALPISRGLGARGSAVWGALASQLGARRLHGFAGDRKSTRLNSSHSQISYAVFCLKKKIYDGEPIRVMFSSADRGATENHGCVFDSIRV